MTVRDDHEPLPAHAERLIAHLQSAQSRFLPARVGHGQHTEFAERAGLLGEQLAAALVLADTRQYAPAMTTIRTALEHHLVDRLLFLANRYLQRYPVKLAALAAEEVRLSGLKAGPRPDIVRWWRDSGGYMNVLIRGLYPSGSLGRGMTLSPYYFVVDEYDPFTGKARNAALLAGAFSPVAERRRWAEQARSVWESLFVYEKLRRNLLLNHLITNRAALQLDVHYGFLSAFAHGMNRAYELVYGHNIPSRRGTRDHYAEELVLLYVIVIAAAELEAFARMAKRTPRLRLDWDEVSRNVSEALTDADYLWFLHGEPHLLDRINEVHTRLARRRRFGPPAVDPRSLAPSKVRYYTNPLVRLVELHRGFHEWSTGIVFNPPFPRSDAANRV